MQLFLAEEAQFVHGRLGAARVGSDQIVREKLFQALFLGQAVEQQAKLQEAVRSRFAHGRQHAGVAVFGRDLHLPGNVVTNDLPQIVETIFTVGKDHIVAKAGSHGNFFNGIDAAQSLQQGHEGAVVNLEAGADRREQAAFVPAGAFKQFFRTLKPVHVGGRATDVGDDALESRVSGENFGLSDDRFDAAILDSSPLVHGNGAEMTLAVTAPVGSQGKADCVKGCYPACQPVPGMEVTLEIQAVDGVEFRR